MTQIPVITAGLDSLYARFIASGLSRSQWFRDAGFEVYLRVGPRFVEGAMTPWVTIANMNAFVPRQGHMRAVFDLCEGFAVAHPDISGTLVESVCNPDLLHFLAGRGYAHIGPDPLATRFMGDWVRARG